VGGRTAEQAVTEAIAKIGENMSLRRMATLSGETVVSYVHNAAGEGLGKIGVLVALTGTDTGIGRQIAMHVAAAAPVALDEASMDQDVIARERDVQTQKALEENATSSKPRPDAVIHNNIIPGRMKKFVAESTLLGQAFVVNPDLTVEQAAKEAGVTVTGFVRLAVGEGIEKQTEDFAAEVAKMNQPAS
jgi:elongation factor Ts